MTSVSYEELIMQNKIFKIFHPIVTVLLLFIMVSSVIAEEKIIQQEKISFEKCLDVIAKSERKLSLSPEVTDESDIKRVAVFTLLDGTLTISCDGGEVQLGFYGCKLTSFR